MIAALRGTAALLCLAGSMASLGAAAHIHAKAWLGQQLIALAWQRVQGGEEAARPWPWADTRPVARIEVPAHGVNLYVLSGGSGQTLAWGPGHLDGTAPVGAPGNAVVGGHRDTHFAFLEEVEVGTAIRVEDTEGWVRTYHVVDHFVTSERDAGVLASSDAPQLTLVTCWPFDGAVPGGTQRYVVVARPGLGAGAGQSAAAG